MKRVLVTGGTGILGAAAVEKLHAAGYKVRLMSRKERLEGYSPAVEWARADLKTGEGLREAVRGVDVIVHAASETNPMRDPKATDIEGTQRLLDEARAAGVGHFIYPSIVGIDALPQGYYKAKLDVEQMVARSGVPCTIIRFSQFHEFVDKLLRTFSKAPVVLLPSDFTFQPMDVGEAAEHLRACIEAGPRGRVPDFAGPHIRTLGDMAKPWLEVQGIRKPVVNFRMPGKVAAGMRAGALTSPNHRESVLTWDEWVHKTYAPASERSRTDSQAQQHVTSNG